jgi:beta-ureidopropionase
VTEVDLNMIQQIRDKWCIQMTARYEDYAKELGEYVKEDFKPQIVKE